MSLVRKFFQRTKNNRCKIVNGSFQNCSKSWPLFFQGGKLSFLQNFWMINYYLQIDVGGALIQFVPYEFSSCLNLKLSNKKIWLLANINALNIKIEEEVERSWWWRSKWWRWKSCAKSFIKILTEEKLKKMDQKLKMHQISHFKLGKLQLGDIMLQ